MANLTATLSDVSDTARVVEAPGGSGGLSTALDSLAKGINTISGVFQDRAQRQRQAAADARAAIDQQHQNIDWEHKQLDRAAADTTVRAMAGIEAQLAPQIVDVGGSDSSTQPPAISAELAGADQDFQSNVGNAASKLQTYKVAVEQGKMTPTALRALQYQAFNRILTEHPEYDASVVASTFKGLGVDSFKEYNTQISEEDDRRKAAADFRQKQIDSGKILNPHGSELGMTDDDYFQAGLEDANRQQRLNATRDALAIQQSQQSLTQSQYTFDKNVGGDQLRQQGFETLRTWYAPTLRKLLQATGVGSPERGSDPAYEAKLAKVTQTLRQQVGVQINNIIQQAGVVNPDAASAMRTELTNMAESEIFQPLEKGRTDFMGAAQVVNQSFNLRTDLQMPFIRQLRQLGMQYQDIQQFLPTVSPDVRNRLAREFTGITSGTIEPEVGKVVMSNIIAGLRGEKTLQDMDPRSAKEAINSYVPYSYKEGQRVAAGQSDGQSYMNAMRNIVVASPSVNRSAGAASLAKAGSAIFRATTVSALDKLMADGSTKDEATTLARGTRAAAAHLTGESHAALNRAAAKEPYQMVVWDKANGEFVLKFNDKRWAEGANSRAVGGGTGFMRGEAARVTDAKPQPSGELRDLLRTTNEGIAFLARTVRWDDDDLSKGLGKASVRDVRTFYAGQGTPAALKESQDGKRRESRGAIDILDSIEGDLRNTPSTVVTANADIIGPEGSGKNPRSSASGVGQFTDDTWVKTLQRHAPELIQGKSRADVISMKQNGGLAARAVGWLRGDNAVRLGSLGVPATPQTTALAHFAGADGAASLLKADPSTPVEQILKPGAINANPHLRGKTAAQVIEWAKRFYKA